MQLAGQKFLFVSHSHSDNAIGKRLVNALETEGFRCWYSSRTTDLDPGTEWDDSIVAALDNSAAVILIFSRHANDSKWVKRELAMAGARDIPIYPIRIEAVRPTKGMEAHLISVQWIDAMTGRIEDHIDPIVQRLRVGFPSLRASRPPVTRASGYSQVPAPDSPTSVIDVAKLNHQSESDLRLADMRLSPFAELAKFIDKRFATQQAANQAPSPQIATSSDHFVDPKHSPKNENFDTDRSGTDLPTIVLNIVGLVVVLILVAYILYYIYNR